MTESSKKKIAIVTAGGGTGHNSAAFALHETAKKNFPNFSTRVFVIDDYLNPIARFFIISVYNHVARRLPFIWKTIYKTAATKKGGILYQKILASTAAISSRRFRRAIEEFSPNHIIGTHFFAPYFLASIKLQKIPLSVVVTDYGWHPFWRHPRTSRYFVASEENRHALMENHDITEDNAIVSGIPISPLFYESYDLTSIKIKHNFPPENSIILILTGGSGIMNPAEFISLLWNIPHVSIVVIAGKNKNLMKKITTLPWPQSASYSILGWTDEMHRYIKAADIIITKPGGLTISECLATGKSMILVSPIPGQEEANIKYLVKTKNARYARSPGEVADQTIAYLQNPSRISEEKKPSAKIILMNV